MSAPKVFLSYPGDAALFAEMVEEALAAHGVVTAPLDDAASVVRFVTGEAPAPRRDDPPAITVFLSTAALRFAHAAEGVIDAAVLEPDDVAQRVADELRARAAAP